MKGTQLVCSRCSRTYPPNEPRWKCDCGGVMDIRQSTRFKIQEIDAKAPGMWRYRRALPLSEGAMVVSLGEGMTPILPIVVSGREVLVKQEQLFPTGSFKDRGSALLISQAAALGITDLVEDSSGNAGSSIAAYAARAGIDCKILVPASTSPGKLAQIRAYGATLKLVEGSRMEVANLALNYAESTYYASHVWNPFFFQGTKTFAYETCEQLGWQAPDAVVLPVGNGTLLLGAYIGFRELLQAGIIQHLPRLIAIQASACDPLVRAFESGGEAQVADLSGQIPKTHAEGIAVAHPVRGKQILEAVQHSKGAFLRVGEADILQAHRDMSQDGFFIEPTSAVTIAGLRHYIEQGTPAGERILSVFTGHGLKGFCA